MEWEIKQNNVKSNEFHYRDYNNIQVCKEREMKNFKRNINFKIKKQNKIMYVVVTVAYYELTRKRRESIMHGTFMTIP